MNPWAVRLGFLIVLIIVDKASAGLAFFLVIGAGVLTFAIPIYRGRYLPRFAMDILDRLSNKKSLEASYEAQRNKLTTIDAEALAAQLKAKVVGQDVVIDQISVQLRRRLAAARKDKPIAVFCFAGPPGVGKTRLGKVLAEALYQNANHLHFLDMTQASTPMAANSIFGTARGFVGSTSYGSLTGQLRDVPNAVVLLDEFEKAHPEVHKRFLTAWNDGFITEVSDGAKIPTNEAIFILTTNAASRRIGEMASQHAGPREDLDRMVKSALHDAQFAPEVLSRIDEVFAFQNLQGLDIARVVALEIEDLSKQFGLEIADGGIDPRILMDAIAQVTQSQGKGSVRDISRAIEKRISDGLIDARGAGVKKISFHAVGADVKVVPAGANLVADTAKLQESAHE